MNRISEEARKLILDDLVLIGQCAGGQYVAGFVKRVYPDVMQMSYQNGSQTVPVINDIARHMDTFNDWDFSFLFDNVLELTKVSDEKFVAFCEQYVHPIFRRNIFDEEREERVDLNITCIEAINKGLLDVGLALKPAGQTAGRTIFKAMPVDQSIQEPVKNLIFAATYKPDIVIDDAISNEIRVVNSNGALIYDKGISETGISWEALISWYVSLDTENTEMKLTRLLHDCLNSEAERLFYKAYIAYIKTHGKHLPALIPQVYMYYDPKTKGERSKQVFEHQRIDFMMIISSSQRVVIEIDGQQHYSEDDIAPGSEHKHYASPKRYAEMMKAHREMSLAGYDVYRFGGREFWTNDFITEEDIINNVGAFFERLFEKYLIR